MIIEHLTFHVPMALQPQFLALDAQIWTEALATQPGYLGKEVWSETAAPDVLHLMIRWTSRQAWKAVPHDFLVETAIRFETALGQEIPVQSCTEHQVLG